MGEGANLTLTAMAGGWGGQREITVYSQTGEVKVPTVAVQLNIQVPVVVLCVPRRSESVDCDCVPVPGTELKLNLQFYF